MDLTPLMGPAKYGYDDGKPAANAPTALQSAFSPSAASQSAAKLISKDNPYTAFVVIGALTFGLMAFSTSVRVGKTTAALSVGK